MKKSWIEKIRLSGTVLLVVALSACGVNKNDLGDLQNKYDALVAEHEELQYEYEEMKQNKFSIKQVLDMASGVTQCEQYCDELEAHDSLLVQANRDELFVLNEKIDQKIPGVYQSESYVMILYPNGKYIRIWDNRAHNFISVMEGTYSAENGKLLMIDTIGSAGSDSWSNYEHTSTGIIIDSYAPGAKTPVKIKFTKLGK